jgi:hypothetical protein
MQNSLLGFRVGGRAKVDTEEVEVGVLKPGIDGLPKPVGRSLHE